MVDIEDKIRELEEHVFEEQDAFVKRICYFYNHYRVASELRHGIRNQLSRDAKGAVGLSHLHVIDTYKEAALLESKAANTVLQAIGAYMYPKSFLPDPPLDSE